MHARTAARAISAAAMAGGLAVAFGPAPAASAMPTFEEGSSASVGQLCQEAVATLASSETPPSTIEGLPGLRCGQAFGTAQVADEDDEAEDVEVEAEDVDSDDSDEAGDIEEAEDDEAEDVEAEDVDSDDSDDVGDIEEAEDDDSDEHADEVESADHDTDGDEASDD